MSNAWFLQGLRASLNQVNNVHWVPEVGKVCDICGVCGFEDLIATCIKCRTSSEHIYCLPITVKEVPSEWTCEECQRGNNIVSPTSREMIHQNTIHSAGYGKVSDNSRRQGWFKRQKTVETAKVKFLSTEEAIMLNSGTRRMGSSSHCNMDSRFDSLRHRKSTKRTPVGFTIASPEFPLMKLKENHGMQPSGNSKLPRHGNMQTSLIIKQRAPQISKELDGKKAFAAPAKEYVCREESIDVCTHAREVETSNTRAEKATNKASPLLPSMHVSGGKCHSDAKPMDSDKGRVPPIIPPKLDNIPLKCAAIDAVWKGSFKFVDTVTPNESYVGFQAHPPYIVHRKAYEFSKQMPTVLQFERLHRCSLWAELFQDDSPDGDDIALYFFPGRFGRSRRDYVHLLELLETQDLAMRSHIDGVELLLFTSKQMHRDFQRIDTQYYLWGVFRCVKTKETVIKEGMNIPLLVPPSEHPGDDHSNKDNSEVVDMEIDMVGGKNVGRVDEAVGKVKKEQCNNCDSFPGFTEKVENRLASAEPMGRPCTDVEGPPGFEEVLDLKVRGNPCKPTFRKENPRLNGEKATIKNEDTSTEKFPVGDMVSHSLQFQTGLWKQFKVPARQLPAYPMDNNPLRFSEMDKKYRSTGKERKLETTSERRCPEVDERKKGFPTTSSKRP